MTRLKPSVSSCCASAGFAMVAAPGIVVSRNRYKRARFLPRGVVEVRLVQVIGVLLNVLGEAKRVIADEFLGTRGVACFEGLDDVHVIADRFLDAVFFNDGLAP